MQLLADPVSSEGTVDSGRAASGHSEAPRILRSDQEAGELSRLDLDLIEQLQLDGRVPYAALARQVGVTEKTVRRRVSHLLEENYIQISAVTDPALLGFRAMAIVLLSVDGTRSPAELAGQLALLPEVDYVTVTTGPFAVQAEVICVDGKELHDVVSDKIRRLSGVREVEVLPYLRLHYQEARFSGVRVDDGRTGVRPRALDDTDRVIIARLAGNGRASFRQLSAELDVSETMVRQRYARLVDSGAVRVMCIVNPLRLGFRSTCWVGLKLDQGAKAVEVAESLTQLPVVSYVAITAGRFDVLAEVVTSDGEALLKVLDDQIRSLDGVRSLDTWLYLDLHYKALQPRQGPGPAHARDIQTV
ncbi:Lrp/AsnC family transcriptional regulator [Arthrobacter sp. CAU 1506]|uniref:Lrp/AsnC family transcriptional regulator n=1 Tax=Arthrobacter sp. CAU 1506 TaxID=2560052 RepID=UPI0010AD3529|nr:Lrp/AsnC family transcriptional regulator [Arthrobacter sp. CAU 1506]TJY66182.1 Lrp/AsnC family transcriptional regulator [Arthrobacter sp. CAU 1506]